jgi:hypothetical protein
MMTRWILLAALVGIGPVQAGGFFFHPGEYRQAPVVTEEQIKQACAVDAQRLCARAMLHGREAVIACMQEKRGKVGPGCSTVLTAAGK